MSYLLVRSSAFMRAARHYLKKHPNVADDPEAALTQLPDDPFHSSLKSHRLKGNLSGTWGAGYDYESSSRL